MMRSAAALVLAAAVAFPVPPAATCAVVFNSGVLRKVANGALIDAHDVVFRLNMLNRSDADASFLGTKWTHEVVSFQVPLDGYACPAHKFASVAPEAVVGVSFARHTPTDCGRYPVCCEAAVRRMHENWYVVPDTFSAACRDAVRSDGFGGSGQCSSGFAAALLAADHCASVSVFGALDDPCYAYHYTEPHPVNCARTLKRRRAPASYVKYHKSPHSFNREHEVLREMAGRGELALVP